MPPVVLTGPSNAGPQAAAPAPHQLPAEVPDLNLALTREVMRAARLVLGGRPPAGPAALLSSRCSTLPAVGPMPASRRARANTPKSVCPQAGFGGFKTSPAAPPLRA